jgi:predicted Co/Zn/Cd cation transporter (cation efflux family)
MLISGIQPFFIYSYSVLSTPFYFSSLTKEPDTKAITNCVIIKIIYKIIDSSMKEILLYEYNQLASANLSSA